MNSKYKIPFGLKNGILYEPSQVERGEACNCICPSCNKPLIAKKGDKNIHHFAHATNNSCQTGSETAIHLAAKQIIFQKKAVFLPSIEVDDILVDYNTVTFDEIILEKSLGNEHSNLPFIPDITAKLHRQSDTQNLYIEIAVTHFSEENKIIEFRKHKLSSIEIDLSGLLNEKYVDFEMIENIINSGQKTSWIYNYRLEIENEKIQKRKDEEQRKRDYIHDQKCNKMNKLIKLFHQEKRRKIHTHKSNSDLMSYAKKVLGIKHMDEIPPFINQPSDFDALYPLDGRLVRLFIYEHFLLQRNNIPTLKARSFGAKSVIQYLKSKKNLYPNHFINDWYKLIYEDDNLLFMDLDDDTPNFNPKKIVSDYLFQLRDEGLLLYNGDYFFKLPSTSIKEVSVSVSAPNSENDLTACKYCKHPLPYISAEYCEKCLEVQ